MKFKGRITACILVLIINCLYITYYSLRDGYIGTIELIGLPIMLLIAWWSGKQYDKVKCLEEQDKQKAEEIQKSNRLFRAIFENAPIGICLIDNEGRPMMANKKLQEILGYSESELKTMTFSEFSDPSDSILNMNLLNDLLAGKIDHYILEKRYFHKNGQVVWGSVTSALFPDLNSKSTYVIGMVDDITERKKAEQKLKEAYKEMEYLSNRDGLTGIANRRYFDEYFESEYKKAVINSHPLSLIMVDIDYFKQFNDTYGHLNGDECLIEIAKTFEKTIDCENGLVARFGGEEFVILLAGTSLEEASSVAHQLQAAVENLKIPHIGSEINNYLTVSLGISTLNTESKSTPESLIFQADSALYKAKRSSRNRIEIYSHSGIN